MTGPETIDLRAMKAELLDAIRDEIGHELSALRVEVAPAMRLSAAVAKMGEVASDLGRFLKWGVGIGAGFATIAGALRVLGII